MPNNIYQTNSSQLDEALQLIIRLKKKNNRLNNEILNIIKENSLLKRENKLLEEKINHMIEIEEIEN